MVTLIHIGRSCHSLNKKEKVICVRRTNKGLRMARLGLLICLLIVVAHADDCKGQNRSTLDRLQRAADMIRKGKLATAEAELDVVFRRTPNEANAFNLLGVVRAQQHRAPEAEQLFLSAIKFNKSLLGAYLNIGQLYIDLGKPDRALWAFTEAAKLQPENPDINFNLASLHEQKKEYERALEYLTQIPVAQADSNVLFLLIKTHLALNHIEEAKALSAPLKKSSKVPPDMAAALAEVFAQHGLFDESIEILEAARRGSGPSFALLYNLGASFYQKGERQRAQESYLAALSLKPNDVPTLRALARVARDRGELEKALSYLVRARKLEPDSPPLLYEFGWTALNLKLLFDASQVFRRLHEMQPNEPSSLYALAATHLLKGDIELAQPLIERYIELRPKDARGYYLLGVGLYTLQRLKQARAALEKSLALAISPDAQYYLALIADSDGDVAQATSLLQSVLKADPNLAAAHTVLGTIYVKQKSYPAGRAELERAIELDPKNLKAHYQLGVVYSRLGDKARAQEMFAAADKLRKEEREQAEVSLKLIEPPQ